MICQAATMHHLVKLFSPLVVLFVPFHTPVSFLRCCSKNDTLYKNTCVNLRVRMRIKIKSKFPCSYRKIETLMIFIKKETLASPVLVVWW